MPLRIRIPWELTTKTREETPVERHGGAPPIATTVVSMIFWMFLVRIIVSDDCWGLNTICSVLNITAKNFDIIFCLLIDHQELQYPYCVCRILNKSGLFCFDFYGIIT